MAILLNFVILKEKSRIFAWPVSHCDMCDVIMVICDWLDFSKFQNIRSTYDRLI